MIGSLIFLLLIIGLISKMVYDHQQYKRNNIISEDTEENI